MLPAKRGAEETSFWFLPGFGIEDCKKNMRASLKTSIVFRKAHMQWVNRVAEIFWLRVTTKIWQQDIGSAVCILTSGTHFKIHRCTWAKKRVCNCRFNYLTLWWATLHCQKVVRTAQYMHLVPLVESTHVGQVAKCLIRQLLYYVMAVTWKINNWFCFR